MNPDTDTQVFISYSRMDQAFATRLGDSLRKQGFAVLMDVEDILPAEDWQQRLEDMITRADAVVFVISPDAVTSTVCSWEIETVVRLNKRLVPLLFREPEHDPVPADVARLNYLFARSNDEFAEACAELATVLETDIDWVREHTRLGALAARWETRSRATSLLLRGAELTAAETWLATQPAKAPAPTELQRELIASSRAAMNRRQTQIVMIALLVALVSGALAVWAEVNRRVAVSERERVERVLIKTTEATKDLVVGIAGDYATVQGIPHALIVRILSQARKLVEELDSVGATRPELLLNGGLALAELSDALRMQGELQAARETAESSLRVFLQLSRQNAATDEAQGALILAYDRLGDAELASGRLDAARAAYEAGQSLLKGVPPSDARRRYQAIAGENLAAVYLLQGDEQASRRLTLSVLATRRRLYEEDQTSKPAMRELAVALEKVADQYMAAGQHETALELYLESLDLAVALAATDSRHTQWQQDMATAAHKTGNAYLALGHPETAQNYYHRDLAVSRRLQASDPDWLDWRQALMVSLERVGNAAWLSGQRAEAIQAMKEALEHAQEVIVGGQLQPEWLANLAKLYQQVSLMLSEEGDWAAALSSAEEAVSRFEAIADGSLSGQADSAAAWLPDLYNNLSWFALFNQAYSRALLASERATAAAPSVLLYVPNKAHALMLLGRTAQALDLYQKHRSAMVTEGLNWQTAVADDFAALRAAGISHPLFRKLLAEWEQADDGEQE